MVAPAFLPEMVSPGGEPEIALRHPNIASDSSPYLSGANRQFALHNLNILVQI
jgi:hypothetical protein